MITVTYDDERTVQTDEPGQTILDLSHRHGIALTAACGGTGDCSTCRVMILEGSENLSPRNEPENCLASLKGLSHDIRIACQTQVNGPVTLRRLVHDECDIALAEVDTPHSAGKAMSLAVLFTDIRGFTPFVEKHLAYDVVHILNRHFHHMGEAVLRHDGYIDKYIGDGLMALFGLEGADPARACAQAVDAALDMVAELPHLNDYLGRLFGTKLDIGIGIHFGEVIVADLGHPKRMQLTAIGDAVNVASRIEAANKQFGTRLLVSDTVADMLPGRLKLGKREETMLKGKSGRQVLFEVLRKLGDERQTSMHRCH